MKTQTTIVLSYMLFSTLFFACKEENKEQVTQQKEIQFTEEIANDTISEVKIIEDKTITKNTNQSKTEDPMNLLDTQAKVYTDIFGNLGGVEELQGIEGFMDLVKKMDATPETKIQLTKQYEMYSNSINPQKKEALKATLLKAIETKN